MIDMKALKTSNGMERELKIESDEKVTVKLLTTHDGVTFLFVYRGIGEDIKEWSEPIGIYNTTTNKWSVR